MADEKNNGGIGTGFYIAIGLVLVAGCGIGGYFLWKSSQPELPKAPEAGKGQGEPSGSGTGAGSAAGSSDSPFPLSKGSKGANVVKLQSALNSFYKNATEFKPLDTDGDFGSKTLAALQRAYGKTKTSAESGDIEFLKTHTYKPKTA